MPTGTVRLHRVLRASPDKVYRAFVDPAAITKWFPPYGFTCTVHELDAKVGGRFRMSFQDFATGHSHSFGGEFKKLSPGELMEYTDKFDDPNLPGEMSVKISFKKVSNGTELSIEQSGIPEVIPAEECYVGWQQCLAQLVRLVESPAPNA